MPDSRHTWLGLLVLLISAGCQGLPRIEVAERLDPATGTTYLTQREPLVFARSQAQYSRSARDYLYLGPVEINQGGQRAHVLWVGLATTIDRGFVAAGEHSGDALYLEINGELMELSLRSWPELAAGLDNVEIYSTAVAIEENLAALVTLDQLALLADADWRAVYLGAQGMATYRYLRWDESQKSWSAFVDRAREGELGARATQVRSPAVHSR